MSVRRFSPASVLGPIAVSAFWALLVFTLLAGGQV